VADVIDAMRGITHLPESVDTPSWLNDHGAPARGVVACRNGLLHIGTRELAKHTPAYFNRVSVRSTMTSARPRRSAGWSFSISFGQAILIRLQRSRNGLATC
jgi:hypothetical protein